MRLNKFLANAGVASRRKSDELIQRATTTVNGRIIIDPAHNVTEKDIICFDGERIRISKESTVIMLNKPKGYISTVNDTHGRKTVLDLVPVAERLFPVGRLDRDTTGLLLLSNDGELANKIMHPRNQIPKLYQAEIEGRLEPVDIKRLKKGIYIGDNEFGRAVIKKQDTHKKRTVVTMELRQGKKREIRRMFYHLNHKVFSLERIQIGALRLDPRLAIGAWRPLSEKEIKSILG